MLTARSRTCPAPVALMSLKSSAAIACAAAGVRRTLISYLQKPLRANADFLCRRSMPRHLNEYNRRE